MCYLTIKVAPLAFVNGFYVRFNAFSEPKVKMMEIDLQLSERLLQS